MDFNRDVGSAGSEGGDATEDSAIQANRDQDPNQTRSEEFGTASTTELTPAAQPMPTNHNVVDASNRMYYEAFQNQLDKQSMTFPFGPRMINLKALGVDILLHNDCLLPHWEDLAYEMERKPIECVKIVNAELPMVVLDTLGPALRTTSIRNLTLSNVNLSSEGFRFVVDFLGVQPWLECLTLDRNRMDDLDLDVLTSLAQALADLPAIKDINFNDCSLGNRIDALSLLLNMVRSKQVTICLSYNQLKSPGASLVTSFLSSNPSIVGMHLNHNGFVDGDAHLFVEALRQNTTLKNLQLTGNEFSGDGNQLVLKSTYNNSSLNDIIDSNHTCTLRLDIVLSRLQHLRINNVYAPVLNKIAKIKYALRISEDGPIDLRYLSNVPVELMPEVMPWFNPNSRYKSNGIRCLTNMFYLIRNWKMPTLFAFAGSSAGLERQ